MDCLDGIINVNFINDRGETFGTQQGLMMSFHHQTFVFTPFDINQEHFTHAKIINFVYNDKNFEIISSRYVYPFFLRVWTIGEIGVNPASDMNINFPNKNHSINNVKINTINKIEYNGWHIALPPVFMHQIIEKYNLGSVIYYNNKITGLVIKHLDNTSLIVSMYFLKLIINGIDMNYANLYYTLDMKNNIYQKKEIYVKDDWDLYPNTNRLCKNDVLLEINNTSVTHKMFNNKINEYVTIDTWITLMYLDNSELNFKIIRNNIIKNVLIPRIPFDNIVQIKYYSSNPEEITFEKLILNQDIERYSKIGRELLHNPKKMFV